MAIGHASTRRLTFPADPATKVFLPHLLRVDPDVVTDFVERRHDGVEPSKRRKRGGVTVTIDGLPGTSLACSSIAYGRRLTCSGMRRRSPVSVLHPASPEVALRLGVPAGFRAAALHHRRMARGQDLRALGREQPGRQDRKGVSPHRGRAVLVLIQAVCTITFSR